MFKSGVLFLFGSFTHLIGILIWSQYRCYLDTNHLSLDIRDIDPAFTAIIIIEFVISAILILFGLFLQHKRGKQE